MDRDEPPAAFAMLLRRHRMAAGLTQEELAERASVSVRTISDLERGIKHMPRRDTMALITEALGLSDEEQATLMAVRRRTTAILAAQPPEAAQAPAHEHGQSWIYIADVQGDDAVVRQVRVDLRARGVAAWVDEQDLPPGTPSWEQAIRDALRACRALLLIASPHTRSSRYVADELRIAELYGRRVYPIWVEGTQWMECIPLGWGGLQYLDARGERYSMAMESLARELQYQSTALMETVTPVVVSSAPESAPRNPYKGLRAFTGADAGDFFGRERMIDTLVMALATRVSTGPRLLALVGASGSGKSSVVRAGLLPRLQADVLPGSAAWVYLEPLVPGSHPVAALAQCMGGALPGRAVAAIHDELEDATDALQRLAQEIAAQPGQHVLLVVDQCEELFATVVEEEERRHFIDLLVLAATEPGGPLVVVLTLRADFYDRPLRYPAFGALLDAYGMAMLPPSATDLRQAIEGPAALADVGLSFDPDLVGDLLFDLHEQAGALPLLQFTLDQLFLRRAGRRLTAEAYRALGGVRGALARHAEATYAALPSKEHRALARALFLRLLDPGATEQDATRRRAALTEFVLPDTAQTARLRETADAFIAARLLVTARLPTGPSGAGEVSLEVSHEALIREWERLSAWLHDAREDIRRQQAISADAADWERHARATDHLYRGSLLLEAEAWAARNTPSAREAAFIAAARAAQEQHFVEERERQAGQLALAQQAAASDRRAANRLRTLAGVLALFLVVAAILSVVALNNAQQAQLQKTRALRAQQVLAVSQRAAAVSTAVARSLSQTLSAALAAQSRREGARQPDLGLLLAVQADHTADTTQARTALIHALASLPPRLVRYQYGPASAVTALAFSPDGHVLAAGGADHSIWLWNMATGQSLGPPLTGHTGAVTALAFSADGTRLASGSADQTIRLWRRSTATGPWAALGAPLTGYQDQVQAVAFNAAGTLLVSSSRDGSIKLWTLSGQKPRAVLLTAHASEVGVMAMSPTDNMLAAGGLDDTTIQLWDVARRLPVGAPLAGQPATVEQLAFSPNGAQLATAGDDGSVMLWDVPRRVSLSTLLTGGAAPTGNLSFSHDGTQLALADGSHALLWDVRQRRPVSPSPTTQTGQIAAVAFSPVGALLATGGTDHTVQLWDLAAGSAAPPPSMAGDLTSKQVAALMQRACGVANRDLTQQEWQTYVGGAPYQRTCSTSP